MVGASISQYLRLYIIISYSRSLCPFVALQDQQYITADYVALFPGHVI